MGLKENSHRMLYKIPLQLDCARVLSNQLYRLDSIVQIFGEKGKRMGCQILKVLRKLRDQTSLEYRGTVRL